MPKENATQGQSFGGFEQSNTTPVPDVLFDELLSKLSGSELKVLLYIIRRTRGFKKDTDAISLSQFQNGITTNDGRVLDKGCGLNRETICKALTSLEKRGCIKSEKRTTTKGDNDITVYSIRFKGEVVGKSDQGRRKSEPQNVVGKSAYGGRKNTKRVGGKSDPQETVIQETVKQQTERKNAEPDKPTTPDQDDSFIPSSTPSSFSEILFTPEENEVYSLAEQLHLISLKRDEKHKANCAILVDKGVTTLEKVESLMQFCRQEPYLTGKALNLKNLINGLEGWLQVQSQMPTVEPEQVVTESDIASMVSAWSHIYKDTEHITEHQQEVARIHREYGMDNSTFFDLLYKVKEDTDYSGNKSMSSFFRMLEIRLRGKRKKAAQVS